MQKTSSKDDDNKPGWRESHPIASTAIDAAAVGAGMAGVAALIRQAIEAKRQRDKKKEREKNRISPNTIVLHVKKKAEANVAGGANDNTGCGDNAKAPDPCIAAECDEKHDTARVVPAVTTKQISASSYTTGQPRELNGRWSENLGKEAAGPLGVKAEAAQILAAIGGGTMGYVVIDKLRRKLEQNRLKRQLEAAQQEYIDLIDGKQLKKAEAFERIFLFDDPEMQQRMEKQAILGSQLVGDMLRGVASIPRRIGKGLESIDDAAENSRHLTAAALASYVMMAGGAAYVTKKIMERQFDKDDQEEPEKKTRIIMKAGSAPEDCFEIGPDHFFATIETLKDCIADSVPSNVKMAADGADYGFLDEVSKSPEGRQWLLDYYAKSQGLDRDVNSTDILKYIPSDKLDQYAGTLLRLQQNPEEHLGAVKGRMMDVMRNDPRSWFDMLSQDRNRDFLQSQAKNGVYAYFQGSGIIPWPSRVPLVGGLVRRAAEWYMNNSRYGRRMVAERMLQRMGVTDENQINSILDKYDFSGDGDMTTWKQKAQEQMQPGAAQAPAEAPAAPAPEAPAAPAPAPEPAAPAPSAPPPAPAPAVPPAAPAPAAPPAPPVTPVPPSAPVKAAASVLGIPTDYLQFTSQAKTLSNVGNNELMAKLTEIAENMPVDKKKKKKSNDVEVVVDDNLRRSLSQADRVKIEKALKNLKEKGLI